MLLSVATVAATGALLACSSDSSRLSGSVPCGTGVCGSIGQVSDASADAAPEASPDAEEASLACGTGVCGSIVMLTDAAADGAHGGSDQ
jgi:hypothetical protein